MADEETRLGQKIQGVEILRTGVWNGDKITVQDLDALVDNFNTVGFKPPVKLGHTEREDDPAFGWVASIRRVGEKLLADLTDIPDELFQMIKEKRFNTVSVEMFFNLKRNGQAFNRALKAVAVLGAKIPAVADLKPLSESILSQDSYSCDKVVLYDNREGDLMAENKGNEGKATEDAVARFEQENADLKAQIAALKEAVESKGGGDSGAAVLKLQEMQDTIAKLTKQAERDREERRLAQVDMAVGECRIPAVRSHLRALYDVATNAETEVKFSVDGIEGKMPAKAVLDDLVKVLNRTSQLLFNEHGNAGELRSEDQSDDNPGVALDTLTRKYMSKNSGVSYSDAFHAVLNDPGNADLKRSYAQAAQ